MNLKISLMALGAACLVVFLQAPAAGATSADTAKKPAKSVTVTVKSGDTLSSIAERHDTTYVRIFNANKQLANPDVIDVGQKLRIPAAGEKLADRFATYAAPQSSNAPAPTVGATTTYYEYAAPQPARPAIGYTAGAVAGNTYTWGQCTWYVKNRRADLPNSLGNGGAWVGNAATQGYATGTAPRAGAVAEIPGHVMYVESVNSNGTVNISEMNFNGGVGVVNYRTISASSARYIY